MVCGVATESKPLSASRCLSNAIFGNHTAPRDIDYQVCSRGDLPQISAGGALLMREIELENRNGSMQRQMT